MAEITDAEVGVAQMYGTLCGEPLMMGRMSPIAAKGKYRIADTGQTGAYYLQQRWALGLRPGDKIWVLRTHGRDVLYAPETTAPVSALPPS